MAGTRPGLQHGRSIWTGPYPSASVANEGVWSGTLEMKPWQYPVTVVIPHRDLMAGLKQTIKTLRLQTVRPYIVIVDNGSNPAQLAELRAMEAASPDIEVHELRSKGRRWACEVVTASMDLAFSICQTKFLYATHSDVFLKRPDYIEFLLAHCGERHPVVGYQMSPRWTTEHWKDTASHTATMYHMPSMRKYGVVWSMDRVVEAFGCTPDEMNQGWPDTESSLWYALRQAGVRTEWIGKAIGTDPSVLLIGEESNSTYEDDNLIHVRSATVRSHLGGQAWQVSAELGLAIARSQEIVSRWKRPAARMKVWMNRIRNMLAML